MLAKQPQLEAILLPAKVQHKFEALQLFMPPSTASHYKAIHWIRLPLPEPAPRLAAGADAGIATHSGRSLIADAQHACCAYRLLPAASNAVDQTSKRRRPLSSRIQTFKYLDADGPLRGFS